MPNYCNYEMKIRGSKSAIQRVVDCLKADYNYTIGKPEHKHFFRVFEAEVSEIVKVHSYRQKDTYEATIWGDCAWSVASCMFDGEHSYYNDVKKNYPKIFMGTTLIRLTKQARSCVIEVFSEEEGVGFSEHYIIENGELVTDETCDIEEAGYDDDGNITTDIDWDTYDGDVVCLNPHRRGPNEDYRWEVF